MTVSNDGPIFFILARDYGQLIDTMAFLHGTELLERSVLLLPPELYAKNKTGLGTEVREYRSLVDLVERIDSEPPSIVFLFSGYLFTTQHTLSVSETKHLVRILRARRCPIVTNDPCWGLLCSRLPMKLDLPTRTWMERCSKAWSEWLISRKLRMSYRLLKDVVHVYPVPVGKTLSSQGLRTLEYFNPKLLTSDNGSRELSSADPEKASSRPIDGPYWLFILADVDCKIQSAVHGMPTFIDRLVARLRQTIAADRRAVLIAPDSCLSAVEEFRELLDIDESPGVDLIRFCDYQRYISLLLFAEYAFYWNVASSSSLHRLFNCLPVFHFDRGHVSRFFEPYFDRTVELAYRGHTPIILDQKTQLTVSGLEGPAEEYRQAAADIVKQIKKLPTPQEIVSGLLENESC